MIECSCGGRVNISSIVFKLCSLINWERYVWPKHSELHKSKAGNRNNGWSNRQSLAVWWLRYCSLRHFRTFFNDIKQNSVCVLLARKWSIQLSKQRIIINILSKRIDWNDKGSTSQSMTFVAYNFYSIHTAGCSERGRFLQKQILEKATWNIT